MNGHANTSSVKQQHATLSTINQMLENTEVAIKNGQSRETGNLRYTRHKKKTNKQTSKQTNNNNNKNATQYVLSPTMYKQIQTT
jgi:hypothetical protein